MKKRILSILLATAMTTLMLAGCGQKTAEAEKEVEKAADEIETAVDDAAEESAAPEVEEAEQEAAADEAAATKRDKLIVGFDAEYPPYGFMDESGEYTGFDLEMAAALCELNGWELVKTPINWDSKDMELNSGAIDCVWNGFTINGREDLYTWSMPYVNNSQVILTSKDSGITDFDGLAGKTVGVQAASAALELLQNEEGRKDLADTFGTLQEFPDYNSAFVELQAGSVDAIAMDIGVAQYQINSRDEGYVILEEILKAEQYGVGFKLGNEELCEEINKGLLELLDNGTFDELAKKYEIEDMVCLGE